jgi:hypothetical protein
MPCRHRQARHADAEGRMSTYQENAVTLVLTFRVVVEVGDGTIFFDADAEDEDGSCTFSEQVSPNFA